MTKDEHLFLERLACGSELPSATREEDGIRQRCRRKGWAQFDRATWQWLITEAGRAALTS